MVLAHQRRQAVVNLGPDFTRHHRLQRRAGQLDGEIAMGVVTLVDNDAVGPAVFIHAAAAHQKARHLLDRFLCR